MRKYKAKESGFTMIELVIAVSILAVIFSIAYRALSQITTTKSILDEEREINIIAGSVLRRMVREFQLFTTKQNLLPPKKFKTQRRNSNQDFEGKIVRLKSGKRGDQVTFMASSAGQYVPNGRTHTGVIQIAYRAEEDPEQEGKPERTFLLVREETPNLRPTDKAYENSLTFPITNRLVELRFDYFDESQDTWVQEWRVDQNEPPLMVRFKLTLRSKSGKEHSYTTAVRIST